LEEESHHGEGPGPLVTSGLSGKAAEGIGEVTGRRAATFRTTVLEQYFSWHEEHCQGNGIDLARFVVQRDHLVRVGDDVGVTGENSRFNHKKSFWEERLVRVKAAEEER
jgi:hypothetical protein